MIRDIFDDIKDILSNETTSFKSIELHYDQIDQINQYPAVLVEFKDIKYSTDNLNIQQSSVNTIVLHIIHRFSQSDETDILDLSQEIFIAMQNNGNYHRISEKQGIEQLNTRVIDWQMVFTTNFIDDSVNRFSNYSKESKPEPEVNLS